MCFSAVVEGVLLLLLMLHSGGLQDVVVMLLLCQHTCCRVSWVLRVCDVQAHVGWLGAAAYMQAM
jgi:hypothetical protein